MPNYEPGEQVIYLGSYNSFPRGLEEFPPGVICEVTHYQEYADGEHVLTVVYGGGTREVWWAKDFLPVRRAGCVSVMREIERRRDAQQSAR